MRQRDHFVDVAKGIGILLIVCIHTEVFGVIGMPLTFIAVPVFFFMSGFYDRSEKPIGQWLPKAIRTLILPAVIWMLIEIAYLKLIGYMKDGNLGDFSFDLYARNGTKACAWFLFALLYAKVLTGVMLRMRLPKIVIWGGSLLIGYWGINVNLPLLFDEGCAAFPLYIAGKYAYPYLDRILYNKWLLILGLLALVLFLLPISVNFIIVPTSNGDFEPCYLLAIGLMLLAFIPFLWFARKCGNVPCLSRLGEASLGIMVLHTSMCHTAAVILNRLFVKGSIIWIVSFLIVYVIIVILSYWLTKIIEKYCPILLGKLKTN